MNSARAPFKYLPVFIVLGMAILFNSALIELINKTITPFTSKVQSVWYNDLILILGFLFIIYFLVRHFKQGYIPNITGSLFTIIICILYLILRLRGDIWSYVGYSFFPEIKYCDLIIPQALGELFLVIKSIVQKPNEKMVIKNSGFEIDEPANQDDLNRENYAKVIATRVINTNLNTAFAIGVIGNWGSGKTSFLNFIKSNLPQNDSIIIVDFNPWDTNNNNSIVTDFFQCLSSKLHNFSHELSSELIKYRDKLNEVYPNNILTGIVGSIKLINGKETIQDLFNSIGDRIRKTNKRIIVFIDDIDRLDKKEIIEVIRLIRNTANFNNTCFIAAYDKTYVINAINEINPHNSEYFLEKIFQLEVPLPKYHVTQLQDMLYKRLIKHSEVIDHAEAKDLIYNNRILLTSESFVFDIITHPRDIIRFTNTFIISYELLKGEVLFEDLFKLELIKLKFPLLYDRIYEDGPDFFENDKTVVDGNAWWRLKKVDAGNQTILAQKINTNPSLFSIPINKKHIAIKAVNDTFRDGNRWIRREHLCINSPWHFYKYFYLRLLESALSENEFQLYLARPLPQFKAKVKEWLLEKQHKLLLRLEIIQEIETKDEFEKIVWAIFATSSDFPNSIMFNEHKLFNLLDDHGKNGPSKKFYNGDINEYKLFLKSIFESAIPPYKFETGFIYFALKVNSEFIFNKQELLAMNLNYLRQYLITINKVDRNSFLTLRNCVDVEYLPASDGTFSIKEKIDTEASDLVKDFIKKCLPASIGYISWLISEDPRSEDIKYILYKELIDDLFENLGQFEDFLKELPESLELSEFLNFYQKTKENSMQSVSFLFKHIDFKRRS